VDLKNTARELRRHQTDEEKELWRVLRGRRFAGFKFRRQHVVGDYVLDIFCADAKLAVELDGFEHGLPERLQHDAAREKFLAEQGIETLRFWNHQWHKNREGCLLEIWNAVQRRSGCVRVMNRVEEQTYVPPDVSQIKLAENQDPSPQPSPRLAGRGRVLSAMTYAEAVQFLYGLRLFGAKFGLENTFQLAALAGNPQERLRFIHVAGTNGKGSTCAMLESIYRAAGLRTGLFTSPHLVSFRERIQVNRQLISESDVVRLVVGLRALQCGAGFQPAGSAGIPARSSEPGGADSARIRTRDAHAAFQPTFFEFVTVMALKFFAEQKCDLVIWETGLGGRLDATNIVTPLASVITNIAFDHQQWLGDTLAQIAFEKAGIIKPGIPVVTAAEEPEALAVIQKIARERKSPLVKKETHRSGTGVPPVSFNNRDTGGKETDGRDARATLPLPGEHQKTNATLAVATVEILQKQIPVSEEKIRAGLASVNWPGRLQLIQRPDGQNILLDGAHNVAGAEALREALRQGAPASGPASPRDNLKHAGPEAGAPITLIFGVLQDKDWRHICETLAPLAGTIFCVPVSSERTANPNALAEVCRAANPAADVSVCANLGGALKTTMETRGRAARAPFVVISGSLYLVGEALELLGFSPAAESERGLNEWSGGAQTASAGR
jgi:dihydrofolate synthase / folylpolyglutamate synthase